MSLFYLVFFWITDESLVTSLQNSTKKFFCLFFGHATGDLSSLTRDPTLSLCSESTGSSPLDHQQSPLPRKFYILLTTLKRKKEKGIDLCVLGFLFLTAFRPATTRKPLKKKRLPKDSTLYKTVFHYMAGKDNPVKGKKAYHLAHSRNRVNKVPGPYNSIPETQPTAIHLPKQHQITEASDKYTVHTTT